MYSIHTYSSPVIKTIRWSSPTCSYVMLHIASFIKVIIWTTECGNVPFRSFHMSYIETASIDCLNQEDTHFPIHHSPLPGGSKWLTHSLTHNCMNQSNLKDMTDVSLPSINKHFGLCAAAGGINERHLRIRSFTIYWRYVLINQAA